MPRTYCPQCQFPQSIAPAALGQPVQCRGCLHTYTAELPEPEIVDDHTGRTPPALPKRRRAARSPLTPRHGKTLLGLLGSSLATLAILTSGTVYLAATGIDRTTPTTPQTPTFNSYTPPVIYDGPKKIDDLIKEAPQKDSLPKK